jgi:hypothetical protein
MRFGGADLCEGKKVCLSKALLSAVSDTKTELEIYHEYFLPFTLVADEANLSCLRRLPRLEKKVRNTMFKLSEPTKEPAFFNFASHHDINRLSKMIKKEIVIYYSDSAKKMSFLEIYHDFRHLLSSSDERHQSTLYFLTTAAKELFRGSECLDHLVDVTDYFFSIPSSPRNFNVKANFGLWGRMSQMLEKRSPNFEVGQVCHLSQSALNVHSFWNEIVIIVSFCRSLFNRHESKIKLRKEPRFSYFTTLAVVAPPAADSSIEALQLKSVKQVVCLFANNTMCLLKKEFVDYIVADLLKTKSERDKPQPNDYLNEPKVSGEERRAAAFVLDEKRRSRKCNSTVKICTCNICSSTTFDANMSKAGPEQLVTSELDVRDLLQFLGALNKTNENILEQLCELSVASMDIESMTVNADLFSPNLLGAVKYAEIDRAQLGDHVQKVQKPIMIAHVDALGHENDKLRIMLTATADSEEAIFKMMTKYWQKVLKLQKRCIRKKRQIARPIFQLIQEYKNAYFEVCDQEHFELSLLNMELAPELQQDMNATTLTKAWWQMLPGKLEKALNKLMNQYNIFSFYG